MKKLTICSAVVCLFVALFMTPCVQGQDFSTTQRVSGTNLELNSWLEAAQAGAVDRVSANFFNALGATGGGLRALWSITEFAISATEGRYTP